MPTIDEESESVATDLLVTSEEMLDLVCGYDTGKNTRMDKFSVSTSDSGIDDTMCTEADNDSSKKHPSISSYITHQEAENMCATTSPDEIELPVSQACYSSTLDSPNSVSSQSTDHSTLLSKFYRSLVMQTSITNESDCDSESNEPMATFASPVIEGNTTNQPLSSPNNTCGRRSITAEEGVYVDHNSTVNTSSHSVNSNASPTAEFGSYVDYCATSSNGGNTKLHSADICATATEENGIYVDHFAATKTLTCPSYASTVATTAQDGNYVDRYVASNSSHPLSHPTHNDTGNSTNSSVSSNASQPLSHPTFHDTTATGSYIDCYAASNTNQPLPQLTCKDATTTTAEDGIYIDHYAASNTNQPLVHSTIPIGSYVDHYMTTVNDTNANEKGNIKPPCKKEVFSSSPSFAVDDDDLCPSPIIGLYVPYTIAAEQSNTNETSAYSTDNETLTTSATIPLQAKRKPTNLFFPPSNMFLHDQDNSTFNPSTTNDNDDQCTTLNAGEYISHGDFESLGIINEHKLQIIDNISVSSSYRTTSHSAVKSNYVDYKPWPNDTNELSSFQQANPHMHTNIQFMPVPKFLLMNDSSYMTESDV